MEPHRIAVKLYLENPEGLDPEELVPVFHRFIREVIAALSEDGGEGAATIERVGGSRDPFAVRVLLDQPRPLIQWAEGVGAAA